MSFQELFELVELLDITRPPTPHTIRHNSSSRGEVPEEEGGPPGSSRGTLLEGVRQDIMLVCMKDYGEMSVLVLYSRNGHLFYRLSHLQRPSKFRIVRYYSQ